MDKDNKESQRSGAAPAGYWKKPAILALIAAAIVLGMLLLPQIQEMQTTSTEEVKTK